MRHGLWGRLDCCCCCRHRLHRQRAGDAGRRPGHHRHLRGGGRRPGGWLGGRLAGAWAPAGRRAGCSGGALRRASRIGGLTARKACFWLLMLHVRAAGRCTATAANAMTAYRLPLHTSCSRLLGQARPAAGRRWAARKSARRGMPRPHGAISQPGGARRGPSHAIQQPRNSAAAIQHACRASRAVPSTGPHTTAASGHSDPPAGKQAMQACQQRAALAAPQQQQVQQRRQAAAAVAGAARLAAPSSSSRSSRAATRWGTSYIWRGPAVQGCARAACSCGAVRSGAPAPSRPPLAPTCLACSRLPPVCARRERDPILAPVIQMGPGGEVRLERGRGAVAAAGLAAPTACCVACCCFHAVLYAHAKKNDAGDCGPLRLPDAQPHHLPQPAHQRPGGHAGERKQQAVLLCSPLV